MTSVKTFEHKYAHFFIVVLATFLTLFPTLKAHPDENLIKERVDYIVSSVASGKIIDNSYFEIICYAGIVYSQAGYLDESQPITPESYEKLVKSPSLFGALFYIHRSYFTGSWQYDIDVDVSDLGEFVTVIGHSEGKCLELFLCKNYKDEYVIDMDACKYNGLSLPKLFGYECKSGQDSDRLIPIRLSSEMMQKIKEVLNINK